MPGAEGTDGEAWATLLAGLLTDVGVSPVRLTDVSPWGAFAATGPVTGVAADAEAESTSSGVPGVCGAGRSVLSVLTRSPYACTR